MPCEKMSLLRRVSLSLWRNPLPIRCMSQQAASAAARFVDRPNESVEQRRARLLYQSRKRGILENDLLLGSFAAKFLAGMSPEELVEYDFLINDGANNEWDLYYWITGNSPTPEKYQNPMMARLQEHAKNTKRESRVRQPDL